jgi:alkylation response protein AidB-like acyl-CoA dehydrogenase
MGAPGVDPVAAMNVYEALARAEASVAWAVWNSSLPCMFSRFLPEQAREEVFGRAGRRYASSTRPTGKVERDDGSFRLSGRWSLVSGCELADWIGLMCLVESDGEVEMVDDGVPHMRMAMVPSDEVQIIDTWHVGGLRGTGSHDVVSEALEVPAERTFSPMEPPLMDEPMARMPIASTMSAGHASICLGIASAALDAVVELARTKVSPDPAPGLPDRPSNQFEVARAEVVLNAFRRELQDRVEANWRRAESGDEITAGHVAAVWSAAVTASRAARSIVDSLYEVAGSPALYEDFPLERAHRDIHAAMQHIIAQRFWSEDAGRVLFGMEPTNGLFLL